MMSEISFERLHLLLGDHDVLELFLAQLLGHPVSICRPPEVALPWYNIHCAPDVRAVGIDYSIYCVFIGPCGMGELMREMQQYARHGEGVPQELHIIMFCREEPFDGGQNYYKVGPAVLNDVSGEVIPVVGGNIYYHVLVVSSSILSSTAPGEVQLLLDVLGGREVSRETSSLLQAMAKVDIQWLWMDNLRQLEKEAFAASYSSAISAGLNIFSAAEVGMAGEEAYEEGYIKGRLEKINTFPRSFVKGTVNDIRLLEPLAEYLEVPIEVVKGVLEGREYTEEDFRRMYGRW